MGKYGGQEVGSNNWLIVTMVKNEFSWQGILFSAKKENFRNPPRTGRTY